MPREVNSSFAVLQFPGDGARNGYPTLPTSNLDFVRAWGMYHVENIVWTEYSVQGSHLPPNLLRSRLRENVGLQPSRSKVFVQGPFLLRNGGDLRKL